MDKTIEKRKGSFKQKRIKELIFYWCILAIPLLQFCIMYVGVNFNSFLLAFKSYVVSTSGEAQMTWVGFDNFKTFITSIFENKLISGMFVNSILVYVIRLLCGTVLSLFFSYYIYKKFKGTEFFRFMLILPSVISSIAFVLIFKYIADRVIPQVFEVNGLLTRKPESVFAYIMTFNVFFGFGTGVLMYSNAMSRIPESLVEYSKIEGCSPIKEFFLITMPLIYPTLETFLVIGIANIFIDQANLFTFYTNGADPNIQTVGYHLFTQVFNDRTSMSGFPYASAAGLTLTAVTIPVVMLAKHFLDKLDKAVEF